MHVKILILIVYIFNYQANTLFYENMRNDFKKIVSSATSQGA